MSDELMKFKLRIQKDVLQPLDSIRLDELALKSEIEANGHDYATLKKAVKAVLESKDEKLRSDTEKLLEYLNA